MSQVTRAFLDMIWAWTKVLVIAALFTAFLAVGWVTCRGIWNYITTVL